MNWRQFRKNVGRIFQLEPVPTFLDSNDNEIAESNDDWVLTDISGTDILRLINMRTDHEVILGKDHIYDYRTNPSRNTENNEYGFLVLKVHIFIRDGEVWLRPNSKPGERVIRYPSRRQRPIWTPFLEVNAEAAIPVTAKSAKIQYRLWSEYDNVPLMIRIATRPDGGFSQEASGPSGIIDLLLTNGQTFYVSLSNPHLHFEIGVTGFELR